MKIAIIGSGMMGSAMAVPALDNGHSVELIGTPLDREIIDGLKSNNYHKTLKRELKGDISFRQFEELEGNIPKCDILICGVSSFGVDWFAENVIPNLKKCLQLLRVCMKIPTVRFHLFRCGIRPCGRMYPLMRWAALAPAMNWLTEHILRWPFAARIKRF